MSEITANDLAIANAKPQRSAARSHSAAAASSTCRSRSIPGSPSPASSRSGSSAISAGWIDPVFLPSPASIVEALWQLTLERRSLAPSLDLAGPHRLGLGGRLGPGRDPRPRHGPYLHRPRHRHAAGLGDLSRAEDRAAAAAHPVARHRRDAENRDHRLRRVLPDRDRDARRRRRRAAQPHPHGPELQPADARRSSGRSSCPRRCPASSPASASRCRSP